MGIIFLRPPQIPSNIQTPMNYLYDANRLAVIIPPIIFSNVIVVPLAMTSLIIPKLLKLTLTVSLSILSFRSV